MERDTQRSLEDIRIEILRRQRNLSTDWEYEGGGTFVMSASEYIEMMEDAALSPKEQDLTVEM